MIVLLELTDDIYHSLVLTVLQQQNWNNILQAFDAVQLFSDSK